jgi:hypothetical protein
MKTKKMNTSLTAYIARGLFPFANFSVAAYEQEKKEIVTQVIARFSRGSISAQRGMILTKQELDSRLDRLAKRLSEKVCPK